MKCAVYKIKDLVKIFNSLSDGKDHKGQKFKLTDIKRAPGSGNESDLIAHQQGIYRADGDNNFAIAGSAKGNSGYFYIIENGKGYKGNNGSDYWEIDEVMTHPGGIQIAEDILVIGNEQYNGAVTRTDRSNVRFYDVSDTKNCSELKHLLIERRGKDEIASAVGLTIINNSNDRVTLQNQWVLAVRGKATIDFYSLIGDPKDKTKTFTKLSDSSIVINKKDGPYDFQCIQLFIDDKNNLFLFGMPKGSSTDDKLWLYSMTLKYDTTGYITSISNFKKEVEKHFYRSGSGPRFKWASCVYFEKGDLNADGSNKGKFIVYSAAGHVVSNEVDCNSWKD